METFDEMYERHRREYTKFMEDQYQSWNSLQKRHDNDIPPDAYAQWMKDNGSQHLALLRAKQAAEREGYPESIMQKNIDQSAHQPKDEPTQKLSPDYQAFVDELKKERNDSFRQYFEKMAEMANDRNVSPSEFFRFFAVEREKLSRMGSDHYKQLADHPDNPHYREQMENAKRAQQDEPRKKLDAQQKMSLYDLARQEMTKDLRRKR